MYLRAPTPRRFTAARQFSKYSSASARRRSSAPNMPCSSPCRADNPSGEGPVRNLVHFSLLLNLSPSSPPTGNPPPPSNSTSAELTVPVHSVGGHGGKVVLILLNSNGGGGKLLGSSSVQNRMVPKRAMFRAWGLQWVLSSHWNLPLYSPWVSM